MGNVKAVSMETALTDYFAAEDAVNLYKLTTPVNQYSPAKMKELADGMEAARKVARQSARVATKQDFPQNWRPGPGDREWLTHQKAEREKRLGRGGAR